MVMAIVTVVILAGYVLPQFKPLFEELNADLPLTDSQPAVRRHAVQHAVVHPVQRASARSSATSCTGCSRPTAGSPVKDKLVLQDPDHQGHRRVRDPRAVLPHPGGDGQGRRAAAGGHEDDDRVDAQHRVPRAARDGADRDGRGRRVLQAAGGTELFPGAAKQMFKVGEETGTLDKQLEVASMYFDRELESRIKKFTTMFEPIMIIFVGLIVGFVAVALV